MRKSAIIQGPYRYELRRTWDETLPTINWVMLNPSTANAVEDDATIRKCVAFSRLWNFGGLIVTNLFAWRSRDPQTLRRMRADVVGPMNDYYLQQGRMQSNSCIAAWGVHGSYQDRGAIVKKALTFYGDVSCLGVTKAGHPKHPLYIPFNTPRTTL